MPVSSTAARTGSARGSGSPARPRRAARRPRPPATSSPSLLVELLALGVVGRDGGDRRPRRRRPAAAASRRRARRPRRSRRARAPAVSRERSPSTTWRRVAVTGPVGSTSSPMAPSLAAWASTSSSETDSVESGATRTGSTPVGEKVELGVTTLTVARTSSAPGLASTRVRSPAPAAGRATVGDVAGSACEGSQSWRGGAGAELVAGVDDVHREPAAAGVHLERELAAARRDLAQVEPDRAAPGHRHPPQRGHVEDAARRSGP